MTLIILPVKNEEANIKETVMGIYTWANGYFGNDGFKIVIVDDGSTDGTRHECSQFDGDNIKVFRNRFDGGKGSALKTGFIFSGMTYQLEYDDDVIFLDGDGQINPKAISTLFNIMELYNAEAVIGNKRHKYSMTEYTTTRRVISQTYNWMIRMLFDLKFEDTQCGVKLFKKGVLEKVIGKVNVKQYAFDLELIVALRSIRCRIADAPVTIRRQMNRGSISVGAIFRTFSDTITIWKKMRKRFYSE